MTCRLDGRPAYSAVVSSVALSVSLKRERFFDLAHGLCLCVVTPLGFQRKKASSSLDLPILSHAPSSIASPSLSRPLLSYTAAFRSLATRSSNK